MQNPPVFARAEIPFTQIRPILHLVILIKWLVIIVDALMIGANQLKWQIRRHLDWIYHMHLQALNAACAISNTSGGRLLPWIDTAHVQQISPRCDASMVRQSNRVNGCPLRGRGRRRGTFF
ncbi:hypothetical protein CHU95_17945 [Niveispirillum lacus]|uniref:Uncharacterized protein n=1 Tax=Niveispirillum lacus TaxID=1981099 RepID=A0A255YTV3_9PROT|nr:hypothetical protein CHU95_17945 [Niveispirillum lacus]